MKYLIDTHILIWSLIDTKKINSYVKDILQDSSNTIYVSSVSIWEISIKFSSGNLLLNNLSPEDVAFYCLKMGFKLIDLGVKEAATSHNLKNIHHKDPFDRILIWQAIKNDFTFISDDKNVKKYISEGIKVIG
jgi:PIN domain nuclease of toxin-antitoxin system